MIQKIWNLQQVRAHNHLLSCGNQNGCIVVVVAEVENQFRMCLTFTSKSKVYRQGKWSENTFGLREAFIWKTFSKKTNKQFLQIKASLIVHFCIAGFGTRQDQASKLFSWVQKDAGCTSFGAPSLFESSRPHWLAWMILYMKLILLMDLQRFYKRFLFPRTDKASP